MIYFLSEVVIHKEVGIMVSIIVYFGCVCFGLLIGYLLASIERLGCVALGIWVGSYHFL